MNNLLKQSYIDLRIQHLLEMIVELHEEPCLTELNVMLDEGVDPKVLQNCFMEGMRQIGIQFENGTYFIAALIMAGEIMRSAMDILNHHLTVQQNECRGGRVILGTIQGDIHDLGKNLFSLLLQCHGFEVIDLGVDITADIFLTKSKELKPDIVAISCVLTNSVQHLKQAVELLQEMLPIPRPPIIIGGTCLDEHLAKHIGSAIWAKEAATGLKICQKIMEQKTCEQF